MARMVGTSIRYAAPALALACMFAAPASCSLDVQGLEAEAAGTSSSSTGGAAVCTPGEEAPCYTGPAGTEMVGLCKAGKQTCSADGSGFGECEGAVLPVTETCDTPGDDNCDGQANEGGLNCDCTPGMEKQCYSAPAETEGVGVCKAGMQKCKAAGDGFEPCMGEIVPASENCATPEDEDCDDLKPVDTDSACVCVPGETESCYTGPAGTEDVGTCKGGTKTCNADGKGYGACVGEILPMPDDCKTGQDEDCDGEPDPCPGDTTWSKSAGMGDDQKGYAVATDGTDNVLVAGHFKSKMNLGVELTSEAGFDVFVTKLDKLGNHQWSKRYGGPADQDTSDIAVDSADNIVAVGNFDSSIDLGAGVIASKGSKDVFVVKIDPTGTTLWGKQIGGVDEDKVTGVAVDGAGNVIVLGTFKGTVDFGGGPVTSAGGSDIFVTKLASNNGAPVWTKTFGDAIDQLTATVAADGAGNVVASITLTGKIDFGGGELTAQGLDVALVKLTDAGNHVWSKRFGDGSTQRGDGLAIDGQGNVVVGGFFDSAINFGGQNLMSSGGNDVFVAKFDPAGNHLWSNKYGDGSVQRCFRVGVDATGNILVTGEFSGNLNFGIAGDELTGASDDVFVARLTPLGAHVWSRKYSGPSIQRGRDVAADSVGDVLLTGEFETSIDFGPGHSHNTVGGFDVFIAKLVK